MNEANLHIVFLALLPKDGTPWSTASLATAAGCAQSLVTRTLQEPRRHNLVGYLREQDAYYLIRQGDKL